MNDRIEARDRDITWWIGCSGFHYKEWKTVFYPEKLPQKKWFEYYSQHFSTLELNVTFYRFPRLPFLQNWYAKSPAGFRFSIKVPRAITHYKQFNDTERMLSDFYTTSREGLQEKLGCVLFQLPERFVFSEERLEKIIKSMDYSFTNVVEFRHESWWQQKVYNILRLHAIIFCGQSHPKLPDQVVHNQPTVYYRFHGVPQLYQSQYQRKKLQQVIEDVYQGDALKQVYIYFNNTMGMAGIRNARQTLQLLHLADSR